MSSPDSRATHLGRMLAMFEPADEHEAGFRTRMQALLSNRVDHGPGPFDRHCYEPGHFTASAFILAPTRDAVLLVLHGKLHRWLQPGGHVDPDDLDVLATAMREVREETGIATLRPEIDGPLDLDIHAIPSLKGAPAHEHFDVRFLFVAPTVEATAGSDAAATRWVPLDQVSEVESDASVMRAIGKVRTLQG